MMSFIGKTASYFLAFCLAAGGASESLWARAEPPRPLFQSRRGPPSPDAKIFLVAGSSQTANFAQEVLDQKKLWLSQGFREDEIACYYVVPTRDEFEEDEDQFRTLAEALHSCYPASASLLREHLAARAERGSPDFLYLFITTHGQRPISLRLKNRDPEDKGYARLARLARYPELDQYMLGIEGLPDGRADEQDIIEAIGGGMNPRDVLLTPNYLREILSRYYPRTPKFLVLQGCYSGGFLKDPRRQHKDGVLSKLEQVTVLTAARYDRSSFGCDPGGEVTYFGGVYNEVLSDYLSDPLKIDWKKMYVRIRNIIKELESRTDENLRHSEPGFYSNYKEVS